MRSVLVTSRCILALTALTTSASVFLLSSTAAACQNEVLSESETTKAVAATEGLLEDRAFPAARREVEDLSRFDMDDAIRARLDRIHAIATIRDASSSAEERAEALRHLEEQRERRKEKGEPQDVPLEAAVGEAMSRVPGREADALLLLRGLAAKDLLGNPHAYGALHRLAFDRGDGASAALAHARCSAMVGTGGDAAVLCRGDYQTATSPAPSHRQLAMRGAAILAILAFGGALVTALRRRRARAERHAAALAAS